jgi:signal transduction histidine kinase
VREALSNVGRHANAATCRIALRVEDGRALLEIDDDGSGFDLELAKGKGQGLGNLQRRAETLGGAFMIQSVPDQGTTVQLTIRLSTRG